VFSARVPASLEPGPWARRLAALRASGAPLLDLSDHNPTTADLSDPNEALSPLLGMPGPRSYEPDPRGHANARAAVAAYYAERSIACDAERVLLTAGTSEGYAHAFRLSCDAGDAVLVPRPSYPLFEPLAAAEAVRVEGYALTERGAGWSLEPDALEEAFERATSAGGGAGGDGASGRVRAVVVVSPNHPTGSFLTRAEAERLVAFCAERDLTLVADEVFGDYELPGGRDAVELRTTFVGETRCLTLVLSGLSKVCGLPQLKLGWIALSGPPTLADDAYARLEWIADAFLSVATPVQHALPALLRGRARFQDAVRARVAANRAALADALARSLPAARLLPADAGWSAVVALPDVRSDEEWAMALLEHGVAVHPGYFYDFAEPGRLVLSLLPPGDRFGEAIARIVEVAG
jgi:aspartate/methionine/tyrosine aminotransferase